MDIIGLKKTIAEQIISVLNLEDTADNIAGLIEYPPEPAMGDLSLPCFKFSKQLRKAPAMIAKQLAENFGNEFIAKAEAVSGYFNMFISNSFYTESVLSDIISKGDSYGSSETGKGRTVLFDYSSPNVMKPFHIGHLGTTVIGHSLKKLHEFAGYKCVGINHLGDWGTQFGKQILAYRLWGSRDEVEKRGVDALVELYVKFHSEAEKDPALEEQARNEFTKLEQGDPESLELWKWFIDISIKEYKITYRQLGIEFDSYKGESFYYDKVGPVIDKLNEAGILKSDAGAQIVDLEKYKMPPCLILKSDGSTIYAVRDIAAALYRMNTYGFDKCVYVTAGSQSLHFAQWFKVVELMGYGWYDRLVHVPYGTVSINGAKLATRTGNVVLLKELFAAAVEKVSDIIEEKNPALENKDEIAEAVGVGAIVFHYLSNSRIKDINFIMEDALSFEGNTGPYAQYTYARTCSILERASGWKYAASKEPAPEEAALLRTLGAFPEKVIAALEAYEPMIITRYILDVCAAFNVFYHECRIIDADEDVRNFRVTLTAATRNVLGNALELICLKKTQKI